MALKLFVSDITNSTLNISLSTFSLQDALSNNNAQFSNSAYDYATFASENGLFVFPDACQVDGTTNCTAACQEPGNMFGSLDTLHNCMAYPLISSSYAEKGLSAKDQRLADQLGIIPGRLNSNLSIDITSSIQNCLLDYCESIPACSQSTSTGGASNFTNEHRVNQTNVAEFLSNSNFFDLCDYLNFPVNTDIGGIGVYASYWIQIGLASLGFILMLLWNTWTYYICLVTLMLPYGLGKAKMKAQRIQTATREGRLPGLTAALVEFQKTQCFFMLATNIAAQIVRRKGGLDPTSLQLIYNTYAFIKIISISGYLPITLTLFTLHMVGMVHWSLLVLSICTIAVSMATLFTIGIFNPTQDDLNYLSSQVFKGTVPNCGFRDPSVYCFAPLDYIYDYDSAGINDGAIKMLVFCLLVLTLLFIERSKVFKHSAVPHCTSSGLDKLNLRIRTFGLTVSDQTKKLKDLAIQRLSRSFSNKLQARKLPSWAKADSYPLLKEKGHTLSRRIKVIIASISWSQTFKRAVIFTFYTSSSCLYMYWIIVYSQDLAWFVKNQTITISWSFGQIVAITVWVPPLFEYVLIETRGMKRGFAHRLLPPYEVIKRSKADADPESSNAIPDQERGAYQKLEIPSFSIPAERPQEDWLSRLAEPTFPESIVLIDR